MIRIRLFVLIAGCLLLSGCESSQPDAAVGPSAMPTVQPAATPQPDPSGAIASAAVSSTSTPVSAAPSSTPIAASSIAPSPVVTPKLHATKPSASPSPAPAQPISKPQAAMTSVSRILTMYRSEGLGTGEGKLLRTDNSGKTWEVTTPDGIGPKDSLIGADFQAPYSGFAYYLTAAKQPSLLVTHQLESSRGGSAGWETTTLPTEEAWETSSDVTIHNSIDYMQYHYILLTSSPALGKMNKALYLTENGGKSWTRVSDISSVVGGYPTDIAFRTLNEGWITSTYHGQESFPLYRTQDGGKTWKAQHLDLPDEFKDGYAETLSIIFDQENDHHGLLIVQIVQNENKVFVPYESHDGGDTWLPLKYRLTDVQAPPVYHFDDLINGRTISTDGKTIYTMDTYNKEDWRKITPNITLKGASQFYLRSDGYGWVLLNGRTKITQDGGKTWTDPE